MADKIYLKTTFALRSDTLENWQSFNPILLMGEPAVVSDSETEEWLKVGDGQTHWQDLPWKKPKTKITDQNFNPTSENAQSGTAVAEALAGYATNETVQNMGQQATEHITNLYTTKANNDERFCVFTTDALLKDTPYGTSQYLYYYQVKYACGYGSVKYGPADNNYIPKIGDMLICTQNGYIYKVAGINEKEQTIAVWYMSGATLVKEVQSQLEALNDRITALENKIGENA
ncbi:MAG: hypothetical protein IJP26_00700 [Clostridia bacterium]|nr:hypothetical protein [Clostridia bacterium]